MKLKSILLASAAASVLVGANAAQAGNYYVSFFGGYSDVEGDELSIGPFSYSTQARSATFTNDLNAGGVGLLTGGRLWAVSGTFHFYAQMTFELLAQTYVGAFRENEFDSGFVVGAAVGQDFGDGWRSELELAWRQNDMGGNHVLNGMQAAAYYTTHFISATGSLFRSTVSGSILASGSYTSANPYTFTLTASPYFAYTVQATVATTGEITAFSLMTNVWYDFDLGENSPVTPFIGAGIGVANLAVNYSGHAVLPSNPAYYLSTLGTFQNSITFATDTDDYVFAWQAGAGLSYEFGNGMSLSAQYRYFSTGDITVMGQDFGIKSHEGLLGLTVPLGGT